MDSTHFNNTSPAGFFSQKEPTSPTIEKTNQKKKFCAYCKKENPNTLMCGRCKLVNYCDKEHQKAHWTFHKTICKTPEATSLIIEARNFDGKKTSTETSFLIHDPKDREQEHARPTGIGATKPKAFEGLEGHHINLSLKDDIVVFISNSEKLIPEYRALGHHGLKQCKELENLLKAEDYLTLLKYVWTEEDIAYKIDWLTKQSTQGHVILMFETALALSGMKKKRNSTIVEICKWLALGHIHTYLDAACYTDTSIQSAGGDLLGRYIQKISLILNHSEFNQIRNNLTSQSKQIKTIQLQEANCLSPKWLRFYGLEILIGICTLTPKEEWFKRRSDALKIMQASFDKAS